MGEFDFGEMELRTDTVTSQGVLVYPDAAGLTEITLEFENRKTKSYPFSGVTLQAGHKTVVIATVKGHTVLFDVISLEPWEDATEPDNGNLYRWSPKNPYSPYPDSTLRFRHA
mgnify:CR=1 FL=1